MTTLQTQIEKVKHLKDNPPYQHMIDSTNPSTKLAGTLGWQGALSCVLVILENDLEKEK